MQPKVLIFDLGQVFINVIDNWEEKDFSKKCGVSREVARNFFNSEQFFEYERRENYSANFFEDVKRELRYEGSFEEFLVDFGDGQKLFSLNVELYDFFNKIKVKYGGQIDFWVLSNINELHYAYLLKTFPGLFYSFSLLFFSFRMGCRKPEPEIYRRVLKEGNTTPYVCLFIDDRLENCEAAKKAGMAAIRFENVEKLKEQLAAYKIVI